MPPKVPLLDEQDFNVPPLLEGLPDQSIDSSNNFCWYFHSSQFYEPQCNNSAILAAHRDDPPTNWVIHDRKEFEKRLKSIGRSTQFVVAAEPQAEGQPWLYQRQNGVEDVEGKVEWAVEGNWYNQGTRILMAPSLLDVVRARLVGSRPVLAVSS
jgi:mediator of RNA polymerase II transcription subunit 6